MGFKSKMLKALTLLFCAVIIIQGKASACSCSCDFEGTISEFMEEHSLVYGIPVVSQLTSENLVKTRLKIVEGYGQYMSAESVDVFSTPAGGGSCGAELNVGIKRFILASNEGERLYTSACNCSPPFAYMLDYLQTGNDTYLPDSRECFSPESSEENPSEECQIWNDAPSYYTTKRDEEKRIRRLSENQ